MRFSLCLFRGPNPAKVIQQLMALRADQQLHIFNALKAHLIERGLLSALEEAVAWSPPVTPFCTPFPASDTGGGQHRDADSQGLVRARRGKRKRAKTHKKKNFSLGSYHFIWIWRVWSSVMWNIPSISVVSFGLNLWILLYFYTFLFKNKLYHFKHWTS